MSEKETTPHCPRCITGLFRYLCTCSSNPWIAAQLKMSSWLSTFKARRRNFRAAEGVRKFTKAWPKGTSVRNFTSNSGKLRFHDMRL